MNDQPQTNPQYNPQSDFETNIGIIHECLETISQAPSNAYVTAGTQQLRHLLQVMERQKAFWQTGVHASV